MAGFRGHLLGGTITFLSIFYLWSALGFMGPKKPLTISIWFGACLLGALFPDIDISSKGQKILYVLLFLAAVGALLCNSWNYLIGCTIVAFLPLLLPHRGITHSIPFIFFVPLSIALFIGVYWPRVKFMAIKSALFFFAGAFSHLLLDFGLRKLIRGR